MQTLSNYISEWVAGHKDNSSMLKIFDPEFIRSFNPEQKQHFVLTFYHLRGNFYRFLWYLGSISPSKPYKDVIIKNISEEFGHTLSHEDWYLEFAADFDVDLKSEILKPKFNFDWVQGFNDAHLDYILISDFDLAWSAFGAYEKLDNADYDNLYNLAVNLGSSKRGLVFFDIHRNVEHYEAIDPLLQLIWDRDPEIVKQGFEFIGEHQINMWNRLGEYLSKS